MSQEILDKLIREHKEKFASTMMFGIPISEIDAEGLRACLCVLEEMRQAEKPFLYTYRCDKCQQKRQIINVMPPLGVFCNQCERVISPAIKVEEVLPLDLTALGL